MPLFKGYSNSKFYGRTKMVPPKNGIVDGLYYVNDVLGTGSYGGFYYVDGSRYTGYTSGNYYNNGTQLVSDGSQTWKLSSSLNFVKNAASVLLNDGRIMFAGGYAAGTSNTVTDQWEVVDPATNFSTSVFGVNGGSGTTAPLPGVVFDNKLIKLTNGKVVSIGGKSVTNDVFNRRQETYILDPSKIGTSQACWSTSLSLPSTEVGINSLIELIPGTNKVIVTGGIYNSGPYTSTVTNKGYILDYDNNTVTQIANMPLTRERHTGIFLPNGNYITWGGGTSSGDREAIYSYNFNTDTWTFLKSSGSNSTLYRANSHLLNNTDVYIVGAQSGSTSFVKKYTISSNTFTGITVGISGGENYPQNFTKTVLLNDNRILIYGANTITGAGGSIGTFNPTDNDFANLSVTNLVNATQYLDLIMLSNNKVVAYGGANTFSVMDF
jgi:hypothetical protein